MSVSETTTARDISSKGAAGVRMRGVTKAFGQNVVLRDLDLEVAPGEKVVVIGPSGSGKTTILRTTMTLERIDAGTIEVGGRHLYHESVNGKLRPAREKHIREVRSDIGMVFQHFNLFPHMTALENIMLAPMKVHGKSRQEAQALGVELLDKVGLAHAVNQTPGQLSGGQKQRVAIARSLACEPKVMLFDEVTSALDPELVGEVLNVLRDIAEEGRTTMMLVTHEMGFAREMADRVLMFDGGQIIESGPPAEVLGSPQHERTKAFLGAVKSH
ncbi:ectoine/hydroxyectoine ABC transporter ATP-binding protein EhuA [Myceligenerans salitolerans]|uniref:Ectoine/hydroxyectoine ABC transporter ATP-binding protein EhuA n=1 Tax=Myceligenerans salitolerans TaxID=1230528 RepID=A0ABS3IDC5_9MICO|nr:ectoine/hydroxyectoine ABC transporter ATP-binding protein EhuA [Myceligenerans salitolerans]MBO0610037.1 ectoine/hydroxyectoine ABC transporter ATP-binding protein EhuA [Myceligenerans salitolerans]